MKLKDPDNLFDVSGKIVLVTGGARGIGLMIAEAFCRRGCTVIISSRKKEACAAAAARLSELHSSGRCIALPEDLSTDAGCRRLAAAVAEQVDRLHVLVNNSGTSWGQPMEEYAEKGWGRVMALNVVAPFQLTRALLPLLDAAAANSNNDPSRVINIGSISGLQHQPFPTYAYDTSKAAIHALTRKLAAELARRAESKAAITVNCVAPGYVPTDMSAQLATYADADDVQESIPLRRWGRADDMAGAVLYLSSKAGAWVTGAILPVDGGQLAAPLQVGASPRATT